jgi:hypothetical protein
VPQRVDFGAESEYGVSMEVPKLYRISAEVERDQKARFRVLSKKFGRTMRAQLTYMVAEAIVGVTVAKDEVEQVTQSQRQSAPQKYEPYVEPFNPAEELATRLQEEMWIPDAIDEVQALCRSHGMFNWNPSLRLHDKFVSEYRERALAQGRNPDKELESLRPL